MHCYKPLKAWRSLAVNPTGKRGVVFKKDSDLADLREPLKIPCGQCMGCRLEKSREWAVRATHEASLHSRNCFVTLTYNNEHLPPDKSLHLDHFQDFMKRLRKKYVPKCPYKPGTQERSEWMSKHGIRFLHCGEYGEKFQRPHYHVLLFNFDFSDKVLLRQLPNGHKLYESDSLKALWPFGFHSIGAVTFESAAYVARYVTKKRTGDKPFTIKDYETGNIEEFDNADEYYEWIDYSTGEVFRRRSEYATMSRRPGLARGWYDKFHTDIFPRDRLVINGQEVKPPSYYTRLFELYHPEEHLKLMERRRQNIKDISQERLDVMLKCKLARVKNLKRSFENGTT
jgi:hypothetical protein